MNRVKIMTMGRILSALLTAVTLVCLAAHSQEKEPAGSALRRTLPQAPKAERPQEGDKEEKTAGPTAEEIEAATANAALRRSISQLMIVTLEGTTLFTSTDRQLMDRYPPGGVIMQTVSRPVFAADYIQTLREYTASKNKSVPLFIGTDLFTLPRRDRMFKDKFVQLPSLLSIAAADDPQSTRRFAEFLATQLSAIGFNMHIGPSLSLAPVLPKADGTIACLGSDPQFAARAAENIVSALNDKGVIALPTDFPGGANNRVEDGAPVLLTSRNALHEQDLLPYKRAIEAGAPMIHVGTMNTPTIDPVNVPACLSAAVMQGLLRKDLGFEGVIVAGPMDAPEVGRAFDVSEAAILALVSGADMLLWNTTGTRVMRTVDDIVAAVNSGRIDQSIIERAANRVAKVKEQYKLSEQPMPKKSEARKLENKRAYPRESYELERRSITLLLNRNQLLPLTESSMPLLVTGVAGSVELHTALVEEHFKRQPIKIQPIVTAKHAGEIHDFEVDRVVKNTIGLKTAVCVFTPDQRIGGQLQIVRKLRSRGVSVIVVLVGYPSTVPHFQEADAVLLAYSDTTYLAETMKAVADVLAGMAPVRILAPVRDLETRAGKTEMYNAYDVIQSPVGRLPVTIKAPYEAGLSVPYAVEKSIKKVEWDFGDGEREKGFAVEHQFDESGRYPITLTVTDHNGQETSGTFHATVGPAAPAPTQ